MQRRATFADLPIELCERIVLLVAHQWAVEDKQSLARLARASRAIHALVKPILFDSVVISTRNIPKIRAALHVFHSTRVLEVEPGLDRAGWDHLHMCSSSFPNIDIFTGPLDALILILMPSSNPERIVTRDQVHLDHLFTRDHLLRGIFSRLTHLRVASKRGIQFFRSLPETWSSLRITHIMVDLEFEDEVFIGSVHMLATLLRPTRLLKLERLCVLVGDTAGYHSLRDKFESFPELQRETRLWLAIRREPRQGDCLDPADNDYWLVGDQVRCVT